MNFINSKTDEYQKFLQKFPFSKAQNKYIMKENFTFKKVINLDESEKDKSPAQKALGLNNISTDFLNMLFIQLGKQAKLKEAEAAIQLMNGKGNVLDNLLNVGGGLLDRELNKDRNKDDGDKKEEKKDPIRGLLDGILGGGSKKKEEKKKEQPKKEEEKKEEPINKKDNLIKKLDDLFK